MSDLMSCDEILQHIEKDSGINPTNLEAEVIRTMSLQVKYLRYHRNYKEYLIKAWRRIEQIEVELHDYYSGEASADVYRQRPFNGIIKNQAELTRRINGDDRIQAAKSITQLAEDTIEKISAMLDSLKYRNNHIATMLEIRKFESGA